MSEKVTKRLHRITLYICSISTYLHYSSHYPRVLRIARCVVFWRSFSRKVGGSHGLGRFYFNSRDSRYSQKEQTKKIARVKPLQSPIYTQYLRLLKIKFVITLIIHVHTY